MPPCFWAISRYITLIDPLIYWILNVLSSFKEFVMHLEEQLSDMSTESVMELCKPPNEKSFV